MNGDSVDENLQSSSSRLNCIVVPFVFFYYVLLWKRGDDNAAVLTFQAGLKPGEVAKTTDDFTVLRAEGGKSSLRSDLV